MEDSDIDDDSISDSETEDEGNAPVVQQSTSSKKRSGSSSRSNKNAKRQRTCLSSQASGTDYKKRLSSLSPADQVLHFLGTQNRALKASLARGRRNERIWREKIEVAEQTFLEDCCKSSSSSSISNSSQKMLGGMGAGTAPCSPAKVIEPLQRQLLQLRVKQRMEKALLKANDELEEMLEAESALDSKL